MHLRFHPATADRWADLERLFGERGACGGCWCMSWRLSSADFNRNKVAKNRAALRRIVRQGAEPGVLAYDGDTPIGWCAVAPRQEYVRLEKSRSLKPVDERPVWSITCLFLAKEYRRQGLSAQLLRAAAEFARKRGANIVEGYPTEPSGELPAPFLWAGLVSSFRAAGFREVARPSRTRAIMRLELNQQRPQPPVSSTRKAASRGK